MFVNVFQIQSFIKLNIKFTVKVKLEDIVSRFALYGEVSRRGFFLLEFASSLESIFRWSRFFKAF